MDIEYRLSAGFGLEYTRKVSPLGYVGDGLDCDATGRSRGFGGFAVVDRSQSGNVGQINARTALCNGRNTIRDVVHAPRRKLPHGDIKTRDDTDMDRRAVRATDVVDGVYWYAICFGNGGFGIRLTDPRVLGPVPSYQCAQYGPYDRHDELSVGGVGATPTIYDQPLFVGGTRSEQKDPTKPSIPHHRTSAFPRPESPGWIAASAGYAGVRLRLHGRTSPVVLAAADLGPRFVRRFVSDTRRLTRKPIAGSFAGSSPTLAGSSSGRHPRTSHPHRTRRPPQCW